MKKQILVNVLCILLFLVLSSSVLAVTAKIVIDGTTPQGSKSLFVNASDGGRITYGAEDVPSGGKYVLGFMYKVSKPGTSFKVLVDGPSGNLHTSSDLKSTTWTQYSASLDIPGDGSASNILLRFSGNGAVEYYLDAVQFTKSKELVPFNDFKYDVGCCPEDFCWTGDVLPSHPSCVHSKFYEQNTSMLPLGFDNPYISRDALGMLDAPGGFRCINGSWKYSSIKKTPLFDGAGFCPDESQCFLGGSDDALKACVKNESVWPYKMPGETEKDEYYYCFNGNWTTLTKEIALQMIDMVTPEDTYTIFCDKYNLALNPDSSFSQFRDYFGDNVKDIIASDVINEFCVMELNGQVVVGVSLNGLDINESFDGSCSGDWACVIDPSQCDENNCPIGESQDFKKKKSFIEMIKGPDKKTYCDSAMDIPAEKYGLYNMCDKEDVYYNSKLKTVIFTKTTTPSTQKVPFKPTTKTFLADMFEKLKDMLSHLLGISGLARPASLDKEELSFIQNAGSFDKLYINFNPEGPNGLHREIKAIRETRGYTTGEPGARKIHYMTFINAEYTNYAVDICSFFYNHNYWDIRAQISSNDLIRCTPVITSENSWMHSIYVEEPLFELPSEDLRAVRIWLPDSPDTFWNDITAKIRTQEAYDLPGSIPQEPLFTREPENTVAGALINFSLSSSAQPGENWIARTWNFGDGINASSSFNVSTMHSYTEKGDYTVRLCIMNDDFKIKCSADKIITIGDAPEVSIDEYQLPEQEGTKNISFNFTIFGGNKDYTISVNWGDGVIESATTDKLEVPFTFSEEYNRFIAYHDYLSYTGNPIKVDITVTGTEKDGVAYSKIKNIGVLV